MRKWYLLFLLTFVGTVGRSQIPKPDTLHSVIVLKITPLALFDLDNTVQVGVEIPLKNPAWSVQQELGYGHSVFNFWYSERKRSPDRETWRSRTQIRYYFRKRNRQSAYLAGEYLFKKNSEEKFESVGVDCINGQFGPCAYFQNRPTHLGRFVNAFHIKWGGQIDIGTHWVMDIYLGGGIRALQVKNLGEGRRAFGINDGNLFDVRTDRVGRYGPMPSFSMGFQFGYHR